MEITRKQKKILHFHEKRQIQKLNYTYDYDQITLPIGHINFHTGGRVIDKRIKSFFSKEPNTLKWIDSFSRADTFLDVGANIGIYSIYAGLKGNLVYAIEPQALNFAELYTNIYLNDLNNKVIGYNLALSDENKIDYLYLCSMVPGESHNDFSKESEKLKQGCIGFTLDYLIEQRAIPQPTHIKIDVDGLELKVLKGAKKTLGNTQSVLIEVQDTTQKEIFAFMESSDFKIDTELTYRLGDYEENYIFRNKRQVPYEKDTLKKALIKEL